MKHGTVYAAYNASPVFYRSLIGGLVFSNTSTNLFSKSSFDNAPAVGDINLIHFEKRFIEVFEETKPLIYYQTVEKPEIGLS